MQNIAADRPPENTVHVAVGVIRNRVDEVLLALRAKHSHQGGLWEFPGGKVEAGESVAAALGRELREELAIEVRQCFPFCRIQHDYADKSVLLDVWIVTEFSGVAEGAEGQPLRWQAIRDLTKLNFPEANRGIIRLLQMPDRLAITPVLERIDQLDDLYLNYAESDIQFVQLRQPQLSDALFLEWLEHSRGLASALGLTLFANCRCSAIDSIESMEDVQLHLASHQAKRLDARPLKRSRLLGVSCHNVAELQQAEAIGADFALLSPVYQTKHYTAAECMGLAGFAKLSRRVQLPLYALGGMELNHIPSIKQSGGLGIAAMRSLLQHPSNA